jgi:hypothetical protein
LRLSMKTELVRRPKTLPPIVRIVIAQATRRRAEGGITEQTFNSQISRLVREELEPKSLTLLVRDLPGGRTRFLVKDTDTGMVSDLMDFDSQGMLESETSAGNEDDQTSY